MTEQSPSLDEAQEWSELDLRMSEAEFEHWVRRTTRRRDDSSLASARRKNRRKCVRNLTAAARTALNLPAWTVPAGGFHDAEHTVHSNLTPDELETFHVLVAEYRGSVGELIQHVQFLHTPRPEQHPTSVPS